MDLARIRRQLPAGWLLPATCVVALLHFGQDVLQPVALALVLSLALAPLVRALRRLGLPRGPATIASVAIAGTVALAVATVLALQLTAAAADLPRYRSALLAKIEQVRDVAVSPIERWRTELGLPGARVGGGPGAGALPEAATDPYDASPQPVPRLLGTVWRALAEGAVVLVLLVFILLDHDTLRDRLLRLAGRSELASAVQVLADAAEGVSRFFVSQLLLNVCLGTVIAGALWWIGVPHAALFGALAAVLRLVPYVGVLAAGVVITAFAAAVDPGWALVLRAAGALVAAEFVVANAIEPRVYGHGTGLAPAAIIVAALFWGAVWGPVGLVLSTPLTLCLVVSGRHVPALAPIAIVFGDSPGITRGQQLYHRALAGEVRNALDEARVHLRRRSFAAYCDQVLLPALALAAGDWRAGRVQEAQLLSLRATLVGLVESLADGPAGRRQPRMHVLATTAENAGTHLRELRLAREHRGQARAPATAAVFCVSLREERDEFEAELLVRALRHATVDARSMTLPRHAPGEPPAAALAPQASVVFVTCPERSALGEWRSACRELRRRFPHATLATVRTPLDAGLPGEASLRGEVDRVLRSFAEALAFVQGGASTAARAS
jgi:predicted PurR-regulated permease PerM